MTTTKPQIKKEIRIEAPQETVFPFFTEPEQIIRWSGTEADLNPTPGGIYKVQMTPEAIAIGEYVEVTPHSRVVFTWGWDGAPADGVPPGSSTVAIDLKASLTFETGDEDQVVGAVTLRENRNLANQPIVFCSN